MESAPKSIPNLQIGAAGVLSLAGADYERTHDRNRRQIVCVSIVHARLTHASQGPSSVQDDTTFSVAAAVVPLHLGIFVRRRMTPPEKTVPPTTRTTLRIERLARGKGPSAPWCLENHSKSLELNAQRAGCCHA